MNNAVIEVPDVANIAPAEKARIRLASIDTYRGLVMLLMMGEVLEFSRVADKLPGSFFWKFLAYNQSHVEWVGCSLHDLIQPSFSFLVGVALPFSLARRTADNQSLRQRTLHAFWRALVLILLGVFLRSLGRPQTYWTFEDTLTQIGLGYGFLYLLAQGSTRSQWAWLAVILTGYWLAFALYPLPSASFDWHKAGVTPGGIGQLTGFAAHWNKNTNLAWAFDRWFLNLFPREHPFTHNGGGYATLSFIPTLGTMLLGLLAGERLRSDKLPGEKLKWLAAVGMGLLLAGALLGLFGICPVVKRIWTPSWTLFSGGLCFLLLAGFYRLLDASTGAKSTPEENENAAKERKPARWAFPLIVVGTNSIAAYLIAHLCAEGISDALKRHMGEPFFALFGPAYTPLLHGIGVLLLEWLLLWWLYRRNIFLKV